MMRAPLGFIVFLVGLKWAWTDLTNGPDRRVCCCLLGTKSEKNATLRCRKRKCWIELCGLNLHHIRPMCPARLRANSAVWCGIQRETLLHLDWLLLLARRNRFHFFFDYATEKKVCAKVIFNKIWWQQFSSDEKADVLDDAMMAQAGRQEWQQRVTTTSANRKLLNKYYTFSHLLMARDGSFHERSANLVRFLIMQLPMGFSWGC